MNKNINLSISACLLSSLFVAGCSQQQIQSGGHHGSHHIAHAGSQHAFDQQVKDTQVMDTQIPVKVIPIPKPMPVYKPVPVYKPMVKPVQIQKHRPMIKPVQTVKVRPVSHASSAYSANNKQRPKARQCMAKVKVPARFKTVVKKVQISPAVNKRVKVRDAQYRYISKRVLARPATHRFQYIPAQYRNITKRVLVKPAHYAWEKGKKSPIQRIDNMTGEIMCRVKVPAVYKTVNQRVLVRPAKRIKKTVPAVYHMVKQKQLVAPVQYRNINRPARYVNKSYKVQTQGVSYQWKPIQGC